MGAFDCVDTLERVVAPEAAASQPPLLPPRPLCLHAAVGSLALGGAERIVLDWAGHASRTHTVRVAVLRDTASEWPIPRGVEIVRFHGEALEDRLAKFGALAAQEGPRGGTPIVTCHLLGSHERKALRRGGALTVPVLHNAASGWLEPAAALRDDYLVAAVCRAAADEFRAAGGRAPCLVLRHFPRKPAAGNDARRHGRARWAIPAEARVIGMIGAVKPQKAYTRALRILREILDRDDASRPAYLIIFGGPAGRDGVLAWNALLAQALRLGVSERLRLPGFVPDAAAWLPAFDAFLNTSRYEGLSVATLEALAAGLPVVSSRVGGQGEIDAPGLSLVAFDAPDADWAAALSARPPAALPAWLGFPSERLWTLAHLVRPCALKPAARSRVLFVTANLSAGGAQRSLVNLAVALNGELDFEIAVTGSSSSPAFAQRLACAGVRHFRSAQTRDCFDHAEALITHITASNPSCVCFWNVDAKIKLLLVKLLGHTTLRFIDVSPGGYLFEEMAAAEGFQRCIAYSGGDYFARLDHLVHKYRTDARAEVIANGVAAPSSVRTRFGGRPARVAICGRIAPSKFVLEAIEAMRLVWPRAPDAQLHVLGAAETRHGDYALQVAAAAGERVQLHGAVPDAPERLAAYDAVLVLGVHQGCPNTVLEALAAGVPVVANDSGGTRELVQHGRTGLLLDAIDPAAIAEALLRLIEDPRLARRLSVRGRKLVARKFSMNRMRDGYLRLFR